MTMKRIVSFGAALAVAAMLGGAVPVTAQASKAAQAKVQTVKLSFDDKGYVVTPDKVVKGVPVRMEVDLGTVTGCMRTVVIDAVNVKKTVKEKLNKEFREYRILGACNPPLAHRALTDELFIGLLLPCNVIVFAEDDGTVTVSIANPREMFKIVDKPRLMPLADEVDGRLKKVFAAL